MKDKNIELENVDTEEVVDTVKKKYVRTPLDTETVVLGVKTISEKLSPSDLVGKILNIVEAWNQKDDQDISEIRKTFVESVNGSEVLKDLLATEEVQNELAALNAVAKVMPIVNNITSYYARRANAGERVRKSKFTQIRINDTSYHVNSEYYNSLSELSPVERQKLLLEHTDTTKIEIAEEF
jgi:hypothetical protein